MKPTKDPPLFRLFTEIGIIEQLARNRLERCLPDGLKVSQFSVLNHLVQLEGEWSPRRLASAFQVTKGAMTNTLQRLEKRGLVDVVPDPRDGRGKLVTITDAGRNMRARCVASVAPLMAELSQVISTKELSSTLPALAKIRQHLDIDRN